MTDPEPLRPPHPQPAVVTLPGEIDMVNARQVRQWLDAALAPGAGIVVADMTATRFCDSMGLQALVLAHKRAAASSAELRVALTSERIRHVMAITKLDSVLRIYPEPAGRSGSKTRAEPMSSPNARTCQGQHRHPPLG